MPADRKGAIPMQSSVPLDRVMTSNPMTLPQRATLMDAAKAMRDRDIGAVIVVDPDGAICGLVTDRDIVVRGVAEGKPTDETTLGDVCSRELSALTPSNTIGDAVRLMVTRSVRRIPVVQDGMAVGIVSLGDLAPLQDPDSALGSISTAPPND
jgi:signal-transduction protein with cAMP-binding, CBS, and nucleotidyltransferase domain